MIGFKTPAKTNTFSAEEVLFEMKKDLEKQVNLIIYRYIMYSRGSA